MSEELAQRDTSLVDVTTGELLPATPSNAARVIVAARTMKDRVGDVIRYATDVLAEESARLGTKTLHLDGFDVSLSGGPSVEYDAQDLMELLRAAGCPEERVTEAVVPEITYKVNRSVLRQLAASNPAYRAAIEGAEREVEKPMRASVK